MKIDEELQAAIDESVAAAVKSTKEKENPFDTTNKSPLDILFECGRHGLDPMQAIRILRGKIPPYLLEETAEAISNPDSPEMQSYNDGIASGEAEMTAVLRSNAIDGKKDAYKSMNTEERKRGINDVIRKNFGIGEN